MNTISFLCREKEVEEAQRQTYFCPANLASVFVALQYMPSYVMSFDCATVLHQNGWASILKSRTTP